MPLLVQIPVYRSGIRHIALGRDHVIILVQAQLRVGHAAAGGGPPLHPPGPVAPDKSFARRALDYRLVSSLPVGTGPAFS